MIALQPGSFYLLDPYTVGSWREALIEGPFTSAGAAEHARHDWNIAGDLVVVRLDGTTEGSGRFVEVAPD